jgi:hypothetical protein
MATERSGVVPPASIDEVRCHATAAAVLFIGSEGITTARASVLVFMVDATVRIVDRGRMEMDRNLLLEADTVSTGSDPNPDFERTEIPVYSLIIDHPEATILWDTGAHHRAGESH